MVHLIEPLEHGKAMTSKKFDEVLSSLYPPEWDGTFVPSTFQRHSGDKGALPINIETRYDYAKGIVSGVYMSSRRCVLAHNAKCISAT